MCCMNMAQQLNVRVEGDGSVFELVKSYLVKKVSDLTLV